MNDLYLNLLAAWGEAPLDKEEIMKLLIEFEKEEYQRGRREALELFFDALCTRYIRKWLGENMLVSEVLRDMEQLKSKLNNKAPEGRN